jgi:hypothetical protein
MNEFNPTAIPVSNYILKITGVFNYTSAFEKNAIQSGYHFLEYTANEVNTYKDFFYPDFRKHFFSNHKSRHQILLKSDFENTLLSLGTERKSIGISIAEARLDLFDDGFGLFTIDIKIEKEQLNLSDFSDASYFTRNFETPLINSSYEKWHQYIDNEILLGAITRGESIKVDDYSGTKYKLYMIVDSPEQVTVDQRDNLLIDLATISQVGATGSDNSNSLDPYYYKKLLEKNAIAVYGNWKGIALLDTFTVFGSGILSQDWQKNTYSKTYYTIYLYCLFVKYSLFKFNYEIADLDEDRRTTFQQFMSKYYYNYISYNFLPTELFTKIKFGLDIDNERNLLNQKIELVGKQIQEEQQDRTNKILGIVTVLTSLSSVQTVYEYLLIGQKWLGWNAQIYWIVTITAALVIGGGVAFYVFGQTIIKWFKKRK